MRSTKRLQSRTPEKERPAPWEKLNLIIDWITKFLLIGTFLFYYTGYTFVIGMSVAFNVNVDLIINSPSDIILYSALFLNYFLSEYISSVQNYTSNLLWYLIFFASVAILLLIMYFYREKSFFDYILPLKKSNNWIKNPNTIIVLSFGSIATIPLIVWMFIQIPILFFIPAITGFTYGKKYSIEEIIKPECGQVTRKENAELNRKNVHPAQCVTIQIYTGDNCQTKHGRLISAATDHVTTWDGYKVEKNHTDNYIISTWDGTRNYPECPPKNK